MAELKIHESKVVEHTRPAILDELDRVETTQFYSDYSGILSGIHECIRQKYSARESQTINSSPESSIGSSS